MSETIRIGKFDVSKDDVWLYIQHFGKDKSELWEWEGQRKVLHDNIFENLGVNRFDEREFSDELDKFCEPHIMKYDGVSASLKELSRAKSDVDLAKADFKVNMEMMKQQIREKMGMRQHKVTDLAVCRICGKDLSVEGGRVNDHLAYVEGYEEINRAICIDCSENKPDDYHKAFKKQYWSKRK